MRQQSLAAQTPIAANEQKLWRPIRAQETRGRKLKHKPIPGDFDAMLGLRIRGRRRELELTLQDLAPRLKVSTQALSKYELGRTPISAVLIWRIAAALDAPVGYFMEPWNVLPFTGRPA